MRDIPDIIGEYGDSETYFADAPFPGDESPGHSRFNPRPDAKKSAADCAGLVFDEEAWDEADIPKRPWIAQGYLLRRSVTVLAGVPAGGKSSLAVSWATSLATGVAFCEFDPGQPRKVLVYNTEDDKNEQRRRFSAALRQCGRVSADLTGRVVRVGSEKVGTLFGERYSDNGAALGLGPLPAMEVLEERIARFQPDVIVLDPLVELHDRPENDNMELRRVVAEFRTIAIKYDAAVVLLHHTRKGSGSAAGDMDSIRGGGSIPGAARLAFTLTKMSEEDAKAHNIPDQDRRHYLRLDEAKANYSETPVDWFEKQVHMLDNEEAVMALAPWEPPVDVVNLETRQQIEAEIAMGSSVGPWSAKLDRNPRSVKNVFVKHGVATPQGQNSLLKSLLAAGYTVQEYKKDSRALAQGIRAPDKRPAAVKWSSDADPK